MFYRKIHSYFLICFSFFLVSCFQQRPSRLSQSLEGTIVSLQDVFRLKCMLKTGASLDKVVDWTEAENVTLEEKVSKGRYYPVNNSSVAYQVPDSKTDQKSYINNFSYVSIHSIEDHTPLYFPSQSEQGKGRVIQKGKLHCANLLTPEQHPFIVAKANHTYQLEFQVIGNYLRALIVSSPEDLPFQSLAYSIPLGDGKYGMPIGGYDVSLGYLEEIVNSDFDATRLLTFREVPIKSKEGQVETLSNSIPNIYPHGVKEIQVRGNFKPFKTLLEAGGKKDVYPKNLFEGPWYYKSTILSSSVAHSQLNTYMFNPDNEYKSSNKIRIVFKDKYLIAYNSDFEKGVPENSLFQKERYVFKIPVKHLSYEASSSLSGQIVNAGLSEVLNKREDDADKDFVQVNFGQVDTPYSSFFNINYNQPSFSLSSLNLSQDYLSFTLYDEKHGTKIKYALLRPSTNSTYTPLNVSEESHNLFPAFFIQKRVHDRDLQIPSRNYQDSYLVKRFNTHEPIVYRFSNLTPKNEIVRNLGREVIHLWNQVFKKAGVSCSQEDCFIMEETKDVDLGDIRYNVLNLMDPEDLNGKGGLLGYGPMLSDTDTGEVISATTNLSLNKNYNGIAGDIYHYIISSYGLDTSYWRALRLRNNGSSGKYGSEDPFSNREILKRQISLGQLKKFFIPDFLSGAKTKYGQAIYGFDIQPQSQQPIQFFSSIDDILVTKEDRQQLESQYHMLTGKQASSTTSSDKIYQTVSQHSANISNSHNCFLNQFNSVGLGTGEVVNQLCQKELAVVLSSLNTEASPHEKVKVLWETLGQEDIEQSLFACVQKVLPIVSLNTAIHEMGHNIGMFHQFAASYDKKNFMKLKDYEFKYAFSHLKAEEKAQLLKLKSIQPASSSMMDYLGPQTLSFTPGRYDVDFARFVYGHKVENRITKEIIPVDPLKLTDLSGDEPKELNINNIRTHRVCTDWNLASYNTDPFCARWDVGTTAQEIIENEHKFIEYYDSALFFVLRSLPLYHKWRLELSKVLDTEDPYYLSDISTEDYNDKLGGICGNINHELYDLCRASRFFVAAVVETAFSQDHYCVVKYGYTGQLDAIPFRDIHKVISDIPEFKSSRSSCKDFENFFFLAGYEYRGEIGRPLFPVQFSTFRNNSSIHSSYDRAGQLNNKIISVLALLISTLDPITFDEGARPISVMDEPDIREVVHSKLQDRFLFGNQIYQSYFYNFSNEELFLDFAGKLFFKHRNATSSIKAAQNQMKSLVRLIPYSYFKDYIQSGSERINLNYLTFYSHVENSGDYIIDEPSEYNMGDREPFLLRPFSQTGFISEFIRGLKKIEFRKSILSLWYQRKDTGKKDQNTLEKHQEFITGLETNIVQPISQLLQEEDFVFNMATLTLLYDYLERGQTGDQQGENLITDGLIPVLQFEKFKKIREDLGLPKEIATEFNEKSDYYLDATPIYSEFNLIKPNILFFEEYFRNHPEDFQKVAKDVLDLYLLELFKSFKYQVSAINLPLKNLAQLAITHIGGKGSMIGPTVDNYKKLTLQEIDTMVDTVTSGEYQIPSPSLKRFLSLQSNIFHVKNIKQHANNRFLKEVFVRDIYQTFTFGGAQNTTELVPEPSLDRLPENSLEEGLVDFMSFDVLARPSNPLELSMAENLKLKSYPHSIFYIVNSLDQVSQGTLEIGTEVSEKIYHEVYVQKLDTVTDLFFKSENIKNFAKHFQSIIPEVIESVYYGRFQSIFDSNSLLYFITQDVIHKGDNYLSPLLNTRLQKEMSTQKNLLSNSLIPFLDIYQTQ